MEPQATFRTQKWAPEQVKFFEAVAAASGFDLFAVPKDYGRIIGVCYTRPEDRWTVEDFEAGTLKKRERQAFIVNEDLVGKTELVQPLADQIRWLWENQHRSSGREYLWDREFAVFETLEDLIGSFG